MKLSGRLIRLALMIAAGLILLAALFFGRRYYLSDAFLTAQIERRISAASGLDLSIQSAHIQLRKAIILRGIVLRDSAAGFSASADEIILHYRLTPLLKKRAEFSEIRISNPQVHLISRKNEDAPSVDTTTHSNKPHPESPPQPRSGSPFEIQAASLKATNVSFIWEKLSAQDTLRLRIPGINLIAQNARFSAPANLQAAWKLEQDGVASLEALGPSKTHALTARSQLQIEAVTLRDSSRLVARLNLVPQLESTTTAGVARQLTGPMTALSLGVRMRHWGDLTIDSLDLSLEDFLSVQAKGSIAEIFKAPRFDVQFPLGNISLDSTWDLVRQATGQFDAKGNLSDWEMAGNLQLRKGSLQWAPATLPRNLAVWLPLDLREASLKSKSLGLTLGDVYVKSALDFRLLPEDSLRFGAKASSGAGIVAANIGPDSVLELRDLHLGLLAGSAPGGVQPHCKVDWQALGPFDSRLAGNFVARADTLNRTDPLASPGFSLNGGSSWDGVPLEKIFVQGPRGDVSLAVDFDARSFDDIRLNLGIFGWDVWYAVGDKPIWIPPSLVKVEGRCALASDMRSLYVRQGQVEWNPYLLWKFEGAATDFSDWNISKSNLQLDVGKTFATIQSALPAQFSKTHLAGLLRMNGSLQGSFRDGSLPRLLQNSLSMSVQSLNMPEFGLAVDSLALTASLDGSLHDVEVSGDLEAEQLALSDLRETPYRRISLNFGGRLHDLTRLDSLDFQLRSDEMRLQLESQGWFDWSHPALQGELSNRFHFAAQDTVFPTANLSGAGTFEADIGLALQSDSTMSLRGRIFADSLFADWRGRWQVQNLSLDLPVKQQVKFGQAGVVPLSNEASPVLPDAVQFSTVESQYPPDRKKEVLRADLVRIEPYVLTDLSGSVALGPDFLYAPRIQAQAYGGDLSASGYVHLTSFQADSLRYEIQCDAQKINSARLPGVGSSRIGKEAEISAFAHFEGRGLNLKRAHALAGELQITRMGKRVADNILRFMDPEGDDPGIQTYRRYIRRGWGVKSFSFEVRDDFVYTSITPAKPPLMKFDMFVLSRLIGLGPSVAFGRMPVSFFLASKNAKPP